MPTHKELVENMPGAMRERPRSPKGYPVPWFVPWNPETEDYDFRYMGQGKVEEAIKKELCWTCGKPLVVPPVAFVVGPMCAVNRTSAEPPSHIECAIYAARACPFLARPKMERPSGETGVVQKEGIAGIALMRNPGIAMVWVTMRPEWRPQIKLFGLGHPERILWYAHSRKATREEIMESIDSGLPHLQKLAREDGPDAVIELGELVRKAVALVPA